MIARVWQGRTRPGMGKAYYACLEQTGLKEYRGTEAFKDGIVDSQGTVFSVTAARSVSSGGFNARNDL